MSPTSYQAALPRDVERFIIIHKLPTNCKSFFIICKKNLKSILNAIASSKYNAGIHTVILPYYYIK